MTTPDPSTRNIKNVPQYVFGKGSISAVASLVDARRPAPESATAIPAVFLIDEFFSARQQTFAPLGIRPTDALRFVNTSEEPTTGGIDQLMQELRESGFRQPCAIVAMGGGTTMDTAKAVANLFTNPGKAADYQGWDLVRAPGTYKIGIPTISGTGAESSRTCVLTNHETGLKLGMNSDHTLFDQLVLDPQLSATVERNQHFYTGMDAYIHCVESLSGRYRNPVGDALSAAVLDLCRRVFLEDDMMADANRERLMVASYLGGCALATSYVGLVHPLSAGLSVVLGMHHCIANCVTMQALAEFYPEASREFHSMVRAQRVAIPAGVCSGLSDDEIERMCDAASMHEKPLANALGPDFRNALTRSRMKELYQRM